MAIFNGFADAPNQLKLEGQEITLKFVRNSDGTGVISWNIPAPAAGCGSGNLGAYDGIVITVDEKPANYLTTSPSDGTFYQGDPTVDIDSHAGDKIDTARVLVALYNDKKTNSVIVTDIKPRTIYYVSGYAVDSVARYHREGVHAYSIPTGIGEVNKATADIGAHHDILIDVFAGISLNRSTGLDSTLTYDFVLYINKKEYPITINGVDALIYSDLIDAINKQLKLLESPIILPYYPNLDGYYWDAANKKLYLWDGNNHIEQEVLANAYDPSTPIIGSYWFNLETKVLKIYETLGWQQVNYISHPSDPTDLSCGQLWYDGANVWKWDGNHWCKLCLYVQIRNPMLGPILNCNTYWFNSSEDALFKYDDKLKKWNEVIAISSPLNPNTLNTGDFWYNETDKFVYQFVGGTWNKLNDIRYSERNDDEDLDNPVADMYWFIPSELLLLKRDSTNLVWVEQIITLYPTDPRDRNSCDLWWNGSSSTNSLFSWDALNLQWIPVQTFFQTLRDPALPPELQDCAVWLNPSTGIIKLISGVTCQDAVYINSIFDPTIPSDYEYWYDSTNKKWYVWNGMDWEQISVITNDSDPYELELGEFWFDLTNNQLKMWNGTSWDIITFSIKPLSPSLGTQWFNSTNDQLYMWNGTSWEIASALAGIKYVKPDQPNSTTRDLLSFYTRLKGCTSGIELLLEKDNLFRVLTDPLIYLDPAMGASGVDAGPMYKQLGIGDDGSPDERRALHDKIRVALGGRTTVAIELDKESLDECIDNALLMIRKHSSYAYHRSMFFLDLKRNQQTYILSNKCVKFNTIQDINTIYRMRAPFFRAAYAGNDIYGVAALQQLYTLGSFDMLSFHLVSSYMEELETLFASKIMFQWIESTRELKLYQSPRMKERVLLDVSIERTEQDLINDRETSLWIKNWAIAEAKLKLSQVRGKFQQLPGANGGLTLNTQDLINQAQTEMEALTNEIKDMGMQNMIEVGARAHFLLG